MAKSARASKIKTNNSKLKSRVFGPIETARTERLSTKLIELATQPKPFKKDSGDMIVDIEGEPKEDATKAPVKNIPETDDMEIDQLVVKSSAKSKASRGRIQKKKSSRAKASIVFPKYKSRAKR